MFAVIPDCSVRVRDKTMLARFVSRLPFYPGAQTGMRRRPAGKTLTEMLVVIAIIATILGLFVPAAFQVLKAVNKLK
jgi:hypothetical protein